MRTLTVSFSVVFALALSACSMGYGSATSDDGQPGGAFAGVAPRDPSVLRVVASNLTSGTHQAYEAPGIHILQALAPDVALMQEMNYGSNGQADLRSFVDAAFGPEYVYFREAGAQIPNGIVSRYPIIEAGEWADESVSNRDFAWARIDIPGPVDLWAVSLHLLTRSSSRPTEAKDLVAYVRANVPAGDYLVIGGDLNTSGRNETCIKTFGAIVDVSSPYPVDQKGQDDTNANRNRPYDWVLADPDLRPLQVPVIVGSHSFPNGLVFDTRVYSPLSEASPAQKGDSAASGMQHMAVVKDFRLPVVDSPDDGGPVDDTGTDGGAGPDPVDAGPPPETSILSGPDDPSSADPARFSLESDVAGVRFECSLDDAPFEACSSTPSYAGLSDGLHTFAARAVDASGRPDASPATWTWHLDLTPPDTRIDRAPEGPLPVGATASFEFSSTETPATFECSVDGAGFAACASPFTVTDAAAGAHAFDVRARDAAGNVDETPAEAGFTVSDPSSRTVVRIVAANLTSGTHQAYEAPGIRILQALAPDVVLVQGMNYGSSTDADIRSFVDKAFGTDFEYFREAGAQLPNGIVSRYPILEAGEWSDPSVSNRDFAWARIDVPGPVDLWAVSVYLLSRSSSRPTEATDLVDAIRAHIPQADYLVVGGDLHTDSRTEACVGILGGVVQVAGPFPADQAGNDDTTANRDHPHDWVLADAELAPLQIPVTLGSQSFPDGLVFDTRVYAPLGEVPPAQAGDSGVDGMQHMAVVKDFALP